MIYEIYYNSTFTFLGEVVSSVSSGVGLGFFPKIFRLLFSIVFANVESVSFHPTKSIDLFL